MPAASTMTYDEVKRWLSQKPLTWLVTGVAGFIGSNLLEALLKLNQRVVGLDNFSTGHQGNLDEVQSLVSPAQWARFVFHRGDIRELQVCRRVCAGVDCVLLDAALGSVPRSIEDPAGTHEINITGTLNVLIASRDANVKRVVCASSSSFLGEASAGERITFSATASASCS